jgi:hypothetical protein
MELPWSEKGTDLESGIEDTDKAHEDHKARRKEIHDKLKGIVEVKCTDQGFDAENKKKNGANSNNNIFAPP